jgi:hypothetical protein
MLKSGSAMGGQESDDVKAWFNRLIAAPLLPFPYARLWRRTRSEASAQNT